MPPDACPAGPAGHADTAGPAATADAATLDASSVEASTETSGSPGTGGLSTIRIALVYPDLLGTYGDSGNAVILAQRLRWRGHRAEIVQVNAGGIVPDSCDLYVIGGGEDLPQALAASDLNEQRSLHRAVDRGAVVFAICAGLQILGRTFVGPDGVERDGLGLLDCTTARGLGPRAVGELVVEPTAKGDLPVLTGYENHGGVTTIGPGAQPLGHVRTGIGNGDPGSTDGVVSGRIWSTYMHGPVLARNPTLADHLLSFVVGPLAALDDRESEELRAERLRAAARSGSRRRDGTQASRWHATLDRVRGRTHRASDA
jgi:CobQ-like glutamine amidotransferase family enzyme